jgi:hypothetical protein
MRRTASTALASLALFAASACGGDESGGGATAYVDRFSDICATLEDELEDLDPPDDLGDVADNASDASKLFDEALAGFAEVKLPSDADDAADFIDILGDQLDAIDDIAEAADDDNEDGVTKAAEELTGLQADATELADEIGARKCEFDDDLYSNALVTATSTPETDPPTTDPPETDPTLPPTTLPPPTVPPTTVGPPTTAPARGEKIVIDLAAELTARGDCAVLNPELADSLALIYESLLDLDAVTAAADGTIGILDIGRPSDNQYLTTVYVFRSNAPLPANIGDSLLTVFDPEGTGTIQTLSDVAGVVIPGPDGVEFFSTGSDVVLWAIADDRAGLDAGIACLSAALL